MLLTLIVHDSFLYRLVFTATKRISYTQKGKDHIKPKLVPSESLNKENGRYLTHLEGRKELPKLIIEGMTTMALLSNLLDIDQASGAPLFENPAP